jgi:hypothetical protein
MKEYLAKHPEINPEELYHGNVKPSIKTRFFSQNKNWIVIPKFCENA